MSAPVISAPAVTDDELVDTHQVVTVERDAVDECWYAVASWFSADPIPAGLLAESVSSVDGPR